MCNQNKKLPQINNKKHSPKKKKNGPNTRTGTSQKKIPKRSVSTQKWLSIISHHYGSAN